MGQLDLSSNSLIAHPDVFADIINVVIYNGETVLKEKHLRPFYQNSSTAKHNRKLKGLYRDNCMEDIRNGLRYVIWGIESQYVPDQTTPIKVMGYDYTAYDRQIEEFKAHNKNNEIETYVNVLMPGQKIKPVITLVLYYGTDNIPDRITAMMDIPKDDAIRKYIQDYRLNMIRLRDFSMEQAALFRSDFAFIAKFLSKSYNKNKQLEELRNSQQVLIHTKDTLFTLAAITRDTRYLKISETSKEESEVCEIAEALEKIGYEQGAHLEREKGIQSTIEVCRELNVERDAVFEKLSEKYHLESWAAAEYMDKYWGN